MKKNIPVEKEYLRTSLIKRGTSRNELESPKTSWNQLELAGTNQN